MSKTGNDPIMDMLKAEHTIDKYMKEKHEEQTEEWYASEPKTEETFKCGFID